MRKTKIAILIVICSLLIPALSAIVIVIAINPPKDNIQSEFIPEKFSIINRRNYIDYQKDGQCSAYASAYVMRHLGKQTDGEELYPEVHRIFGFVPPNSVVKLFQEYGYNARAYRGDINTLKQRILV